MANEMVERVARALCGVHDQEEDMVYRAHPSGIWLDEGQPYWTGYTDMARAAIAAIREPTENMLNVAFSVDEYGVVDIDAQRAGWQAMIDAALKD